jgi:tungstate transport system substrate-binding protein
MIRWFNPLVCGLCLLSSALVAQSSKGFVYLASTIDPIDSGIVDALETAFEKDTGIRLVLVHAKALEERFVADGYGLERVPLMYNDFVIVGPAADPGGIKGMKNALEALKVLAAKAAPFVTRGDNSGTHVAEKDLWAKAGLKPAGPWYQLFAKGAEGNTATLLYTDAQNAYTVIDRASYLGARDKIKLAVLVEGDEVLLNHISLIPVNPAKCPKANLKDATAFLNWLTAVDKGQKLIVDFGKDKYGQALFIPESKAWKAM